MRKRNNSGAALRLAPCCCVGIARSGGRRIGRRLHQDGNLLLYRGGRYNQDLRGTHIGRNPHSARCRKALGQLFGNVIKVRRRRYRIRANDLILSLGASRGRSIAACRLARINQLCDRNFAHG